MPMRRCQEVPAPRSTQAYAPAGSRIVDGESGSKPAIDNSMLGSGTIVAGASVSHSILYRGVRVADQARVMHSLLFDGVTVGAGAVLNRCIVDKGVTIPPGESIGIDSARDRQRFTVSESGVVVVPKNFCFALSDTNRDAATAQAKTPAQHFAAPCAAKK